MKKLTTNKDAKTAIRQHIAEQLSDTYNNFDELQNQLRALKDNRTFTDYHAGKRLVEGGCLLIYNADIEQFLLLNNLTTEDHIKKYDDGKKVLSPFDFYAHLIARELQTASRWYDDIVKTL